MKIVSETRKLLGFESQENAVMVVAIFCELKTSQPPN